MLVDMTDELGSELLEAIDELDDLAHEARPVPLTDEVRLRSADLASAVDRIDAAVPPTLCGRTEAARLEAELSELRRLVSSAARIPLTDQVRLNLEKLYAALDEIRRALPRSIADARWRERERRETELHGPEVASRIVADSRRSAEAAGRVHELASEFEELMSGSGLGAFPLVKVDRRRALDLLDGLESETTTAIRLRSSDGAESQLARALAPVHVARQRITDARPKGITSGEIRLRRAVAQKLATGIDTTMVAALGVKV